MAILPGRAAGLFSRNKPQSSLQNWPLPRLRFPLYRGAKSFSLRQFWRRAPLPRGILLYRVHELLPLQTKLRTALVPELVSDLRCRRRFRPWSGHPVIAHGADRYLDCLPGAHARKSRFAFGPVRGAAFYFALRSILGAL